MDDIEQQITVWQAGLCKELDIASLYARNPVAHKWKDTYRSLCIRETVAWRFLDLARQSWLLHKQGHALGARILLRSAFETLAILIYLNQLTRKVIAEELEWLQYSQKTISLLAGSRDGSTDVKATNILTILEKCESAYPGIGRMYAMLSESAHPNYDGMRVAYSETDPKRYITRFSNRTGDLYAKMHPDGVRVAMSVFRGEYDIEWPKAFDALEEWLVENDAKLNGNRA